MQQRLEILLVEDNPGDVLLTQEAFRDNSLTHHLSVAENGEDALRLLRREGQYGDAPQPDVILLDLNLPKMDGRELLAELKNDPALRHIPVIVLTSSNSGQDVSKAYKLHANCYLTKPIEVDEFLHKMKSLEEFWLNIVRLPNR